MGLTSFKSMLMCNENGGIIQQPQMSAPCIFQPLQFQSLVNSFCYSAVAFESETSQV